MEVDARWQTGRGPDVTLQSRQQGSLAIDQIEPLVGDARLEDLVQAPQLLQSSQDGVVEVSRPGDGGYPRVLLDRDDPEAATTEETRQYGTHRSDTDDCDIPVCTVVKRCHFVVPASSSRPRCWILEKGMVVRMIWHVKRPDIDGDPDEGDPGEEASSVGSTACSRSSASRARPS